MLRVRDVLNGLKHGTKDLQTASITFKHRGAPGDLKTISGSQVTDILVGSMKILDKWGLDASEIPYHRIQLIQQGKETLFNREDYGKTRVREPKP